MLLSKEGIKKEAKDKLFEELFTDARYIYNVGCLPGQVDKPWFKYVITP